MTFTRAVILFTVFVGSAMAASCADGVPGPGGDSGFSCEDYCAGYVGPINNQLYRLDSVQGDTPWAQSLERLHIDATMVVLDYTDLDGTAQTASWQLVE